MLSFTTKDNIRSRAPCESHQESVGEPRSQSGRLHDHLQRQQVVNTHISDNNANEDIHPTNPFSEAKRTIGIYPINRRDITHWILTDQDDKDILDDDICIH